MARLRVATAADAAEPNASCLAALDLIREGVESGEITNFVALIDGPQVRDMVLGGEVDGHAMLGFAVTKLVGVIQDASE